MSCIFKTIIRFIVRVHRKTIASATKMHSKAALFHHFSQDGFDFHEMHRALSSRSSTQKASMWKMATLLSKLQTTQRPSVRHYSTVVIRQTKFIEDQRSKAYSIHKNAMLQPTNTGHNEKIIQQFSLCNNFGMVWPS